jgi:hypothetical protein
MRQRATRDYVLSTFEKFRALPGTQFEESRFLDFLIANPAEVGAVRNSFAGLRRFNKFIDSIEVELGICFSQADLERTFSVDAFVERASTLQSSPKGSLASLKNRERAGAGWAPVVLLDLILVAVAAGLRDTPVIAALLLSAVILISAAFYVYARRNRHHLARLRQQVESAGALTPPNIALERTGER